MIDIDVKVFWSVVVITFGKSQIAVYSCILIGFIDFIDRGLVRPARGRLWESKAKQSTV